MTQPKFKILLVALAMACHADLASANSATEAAKSDNKKAYGNFYRAYRSSPNRSAGTAQQLSKTILAPAQNKLNDAVTHEQKSKSAHIHSSRDAKKVAEERNQRKISKRKTTEPFLNNSSAQAETQQRTSSPPVQRTSAPRGASTQRQTVLDGSNVPKQLEFAPQQKKPSAPELKAGPDGIYTPKPAP